MTPPQPILQVQNLSKHFPISKGLANLLTGKQPRMVHAVDGVSFNLEKGEILALVGESGSGKTTVGLNVLGLQTPTKGRIFFDGFDVAEWSHGRGATLETSSGVLAGLSRRRRVMLLRERAQLIFQDPYESLNPRQRIFDILAEPLNIHKLTRTAEEKQERIRAALEACGLAPADHYWGRFPAELSGGQRQRVAIAGALVLEPELLVADEPVSMLDVSIRADVLNLLHDLRRERGITILYTTHDLATAGFFTDRMAVMYLGRIMELGPTEAVLSSPGHPYTQALISVIPVPNPRKRHTRTILQGEIPNPIDIPVGCRFHPRCPKFIPACKEAEPELKEVSSGHQVACIRAGE